MTAAHCIFPNSALSVLSVTFGKVGRKDPGLGGKKKKKVCILRILTLTLLAAFVLIMLSAS